MDDNNPVVTRALALTRRNLGKVDPFNLPPAPSMENPPADIAGIGHNMPPVEVKKQRFQVASPNYEIKSAKAASFPEPTKFGTVTTKTMIDAFDRAIKNHLSLSEGDRILNSQEAAKRLGKYIGVTKEGKTVPLLGKNAKLMKSETGYGDEEPIKLEDGRGVETTGLALSPAYEEGKMNLCPNHDSCKLECLGKTSGNYFKLGGGQDLSEFKGPRLNSLNKTIAMLREPEAFAVKLYDEINAAKIMAAMNGNQLGVRLNVLSDINPRVHKSIIENHPNVAFYDYTKNNTDPIAPNHHYTYSSTGLSQPAGLNGNEESVENKNSNWKQMRKRLDNGDNVAMAFSHKEHLPEKVFDQETGKTYRVVNGDSHDYRPLDIQPEGADGVIIGLKSKKATGKIESAYKDSKGFFVHYDPRLKKTEKGTYEREPSSKIGPSGKPMLGSTIPTNRTVIIAPQTKQAKTFDNDGKVVEKKRGGEIEMKRKLNIDDYYSQFHNLDKHHDSADAARPEWHQFPKEIRKHGKPVVFRQKKTSGGQVKGKRPPIIDSAIRVIDDIGTPLPDAAEFARQILSKRGRP